MADKKPHINLSDLPKKDPFQAPEGYFDSLQDKIDRRIQSPHEAKVIQLNWKYIGYAVAASVTLLVAVLFGIQKDQPSAEALIAEVSIEDCVAYLQESDIEIDDIVENVSAETWVDPLVTPHPIDSGFQEEDLNLLYEQFGVSTDNDLQLL